MSHGLPVGRHGFKEPPQKCCARCLRVMRMVNGRLECEKHGPPAKR